LATALEGVEPIDLDCLRLAGAQARPDEREQAFDPRRLLRSEDVRVLLLDLDTLRPDHLGCYGYHRDTSPNLDRIAAAGTRFDEYYVSDAPCLPSRAALWSGMFGIRNGTVGHGGTAADLRLFGKPRGFKSPLAYNNLWRIFRTAGMHTCSISPFAERHSSYWFLAGLNEMHNHAGRSGNESAEEITPVVMQWLDDNADRDNWLLHVNYWDAHTPYRAPESFGNPFTDEPIPDWLTAEYLSEHRTLTGPYTARDNGDWCGEPNPDFPRMNTDLKDLQALRDRIDGYDCGIRYMDQHVGMILDKLQQQGLLDDTAIIVTADHGENFGELGIYSEHATADRSTCRIPMLVKWPGTQGGQVDSGLHYSVDLLPTLCDLLGADMPWGRENWDGRSYAESITDQQDTGRNELILSQCAHVCQRSVRWGDWLYMRTYHDGMYAHFAEEMLFNLKEDPHETNNLAAERPELCQEAARRLEAWREDAMSRQPFADKRDPLDTVLAEGGPEHCSTKLVSRDNIFPAYFDRLEQTGRGQWIPAIRRRHPEYFRCSGEGD
jgi:choline-sulfatase